VAAELYMQDQPGVRVTVAISGTGGGFQKFCIGETDGNNSSRPIRTRRDRAICEENDIGYDFVQVANDALSVVVNPDLPVDCLTVDQISRSGTTARRSTPGATSTASTCRTMASAEALTLYGPGSDSGTFDFFTEEINGETGKIRTTTSTSARTTWRRSAIEGDPYAMGYIPFSYYQESARRG
jgi:phosphate transport system substrate-binding protein